MRLRLTIQRHGLPPVQLLWVAGHVLPAPYAAAGSSITISQLVEQVNDIIPLESDDWGLEDYAVEVRGFECLHFYEVGQVLKEYDEVCIRPLQTSDLRARKITGRHQISADGKHLIDGVAFGRPFLRKTDRPAIRIPPRKRRRLTYDEEEDVNGVEPANDRQIVVRAGFDNTDGATASGASDDDEDSAPDDEEDEDLGAELKNLQGDVSVGLDGDNSVTVSGSHGRPTRITRSRKSPKGLGLLQLLDDNGRPFAGQYRNPLLDKYGGDEPFHKQPALKVRLRHAHGYSQRGVQDSSASPERINRRGSTGSNKSVRFEDEEPATPATVREFEDSEDVYDSDFEPPEVDESDKENAEPRIEDTDNSTSLSDSSDSSSSTFSELQLSESEETSSSGSSSSGSSSDSEPEQQSSKLSRQAADSSETSSSDSSSKGDSESEAETTEAQQTQTKKVAAKRALQKCQWALSNVKPAVAEEQGGSIASPSLPKAIVPFEGAKKTKARNRRRKESKRLARLKGKGLLPSNANKADYKEFLESNGAVEFCKNETVEQPQEEDIGHGVDFEAKRQALLASIASGGIDISPAPNQKHTEPELTQTDGQIHIDDTTSSGPVATHPNEPTEHASKGGTTLRSNRSTVVEQMSGTEDIEPEFPQERQAPVNGILEAGAPKPVTTQHDEPMVDTPTSAKEAQDQVAEDMTDRVPTSTTPLGMEQSSKESRTPTTQHRRSKLDLSGTKRLLFGSLGLRTPKTKEDESKIREKLMKDAKPAKQAEPDKEVATASDVAAAAAADDKWKEKIDLRAVECCQEGIELSTPPFPFVQRWDPQQQGGYNHGNNKKRKGKKRQRNNYSYYEESSYQSSHNKAVRHNEWDAPRQELKRKRRIAYENVETHGLDQHHENFEDSIKVNEQLQRETEDVLGRTLVEAEVEDLPPLPKDPTARPVLTRETATPGVIIAFKSFMMSADTNWQPSISEYRTAIIKDVLNDGVLQMGLARRDRAAKDIQYDEQTGERVYGKFEMPGYSEEEGEIDGSNVEIPYDELIDPILVRAEDEHQNQELQSLQQERMDQQNQQKAQSATQGAFNDSTTLQNGHAASDQAIPGLDGTAEEAKSPEPVMPNEESRREISNLIKDAGWRSSIGSAVDGDLIAHQDDDPVRNKEREQMAPPDAPSPKFHGFSSSPALDVIEVASSPIPAEIQVVKSEHDPNFEIADSLPLPVHPHSDTLSMVCESKTTVEYPDLPQEGDKSYVPQAGEDSELFQDEAQHRSDPVGNDHQATSQDLLSLNGMDQSPAQSTCSRSRPSQEKSSPNISKTRDHPTDSEDEFPPLFSQAFEARMSQEVDIKPEFSSQEPSISPPAKRKCKPNSNDRHGSSQRESHRDWKPEGEWSGIEEDAFIEEDDGASTPRASQLRTGSQVADLTISSGPPHTIYSEDDDDSYVLPSGPGWVKKARTSGARNVPAKANSRRRKTKSR